MKLGTALALGSLTLLCACDPRELLRGEEKKDGAAVGGTLQTSPAQTLPPANPNASIGTAARDAASLSGVTDGLPSDKLKLDKKFDGSNGATDNVVPGADGVLASAGGGVDPRTLVNAQSTVGKGPLTKVVPPKPAVDGILPPTDLSQSDASVAPVTHADVSAAAAMAQDDPLAKPASGKKAAAKDPADANKDQILIVGDSHSAKGVKTLGVWLPLKLKNVKGRAVDVYAVGGASSNWYTRGNRVKLNSNVRSTLKLEVPGVAKLDELVTARTKVVIIVLATNHISWQGLKNGQGGGAYHLDASETLAKAAAAGGRKCFWVGQPDMIGLKGTDAAKARAAIASYEAKLEAKVGGACKYVKIFDKTRYSTGDGVHYGDYEQVADAAAAQIALP